LFSSPGDITRLLDETEEWEKEWAATLYDVISQYDKELAATATAGKVGKSSQIPVQKKTKTSH
jgi:hypothetical protein